MEAPQSAGLLARVVKGLGTVAKAGPGCPALGGNPEAELGHSAAGSDLARLSKSPSNLLSWLEMPEPRGQNILKSLQPPFFFVVSAAAAAARLSTKFLICAQLSLMLQAEAHELQLLADILALKGALALDQALSSLFCSSACLSSRLVSPLPQNDALQPAHLLLGVAAAQLLMDSHGERCLVGESLHPTPTLRDTQTHNPSHISSPKNAWGLRPGMSIC
ncbi:MAG: hypothetical protein FRX49_07980 [Trebouxia sp. A1-2]|nr:MAG: hypothetical protein FRX49_07980 [Trebouxia sp. A1-2]